MQIATTKNMLTILESCQISPPPATIGNRNLLVFPKPNDSSLARQPEIRYEEGDYVVLTFVECGHLDFDDLIGNHPRACDKFYPLVPSLGHVVRESDFMVIPLFAVQVTFYENSGFSIGITNHHVLCDASTKYDFLMAWTSIARHGTDELFLAKRSNLPVYDRLIKYPDSFDQMFIKESGVETLYSKYQLPELIGPSCKVRATLILTKAKINLIKSWVSRQVPTL
nr:malonyl-coenzyme A:anthocyanin 3-O-glucoside-6''-O-malonyltransferase-like [Tanacetum cinerariifolium]